MWTAISSVLLVASLASAEIPKWMQCYPTGEYTIPDDLYCDKYYKCKDGKVTEQQCEDGFGFVPYGDCKLLYQVQCGSRTQLQPPKGSGKCPRMNGAFPAPENCGHFYKCYKGVAADDSCPRGQVFDAIRVECRYPSLAEQIECGRIWFPEQHTAQVPQQVVVNISPAVPDDNGRIQLVPDPDMFKCPVVNVYLYGDHSRQAIPGQCKFFLLCIKDGTKKVAGCPDGQGFNPKTTICEDVKNIPACN